MAVEKGPHVSALAPEVIDQMQVEAREKEKQGFEISKWEELKKNLPSELKLSPLSMIPHNFINTVQSSTSSSN